MNARVENFLAKILKQNGSTSLAQSHAKTGFVSSGQMHQPKFSTAPRSPVPLTRVKHPDGRMSTYPPPSQWDDWVEYDGKAWPKRIPRHYNLVPTICFNCESACGLLAYVDKETYEIKKFEGNPAHPGSRGRNCAKGPATHNQVYDPERILYPLKRVGQRGEGKWKRVSWDEVLDEISEKMRASHAKRKDGIMYHVGRPGEDHYTNRVISAWGVDGHNSHTNICSAAARCGYTLWSGADRPSPDYSNAQVILLVSSHLETGHYFNPHAQRIIEGQSHGAKIITLDPRLSNTAAKSDVWLPTWPGSEQTLLLALANHLIQNDLYDKEFMRQWVNWSEFLEHSGECIKQSSLETKQKTELLSYLPQAGARMEFNVFERALKVLYREFTFERAAEESQVPIERIREAADAIARAGNKVAAHVWRSASMGNRGGWQVARTLFFINVLTGSVGNKGGTSLNSWNKFVPKPYKPPPPFNAWNELHLPHEWPFAMYEMSFLLPHFLKEGRGDIDVYFTRVYNPMWTNPDGFMWLDALRDEDKIKTHVALTPTWNESAWFADYILPMGHAGERHDLMSQETHAGMWVGFRQPVRRVAMEKAGIKIKHTFEANPGEVWEENEFWVEVTGRMDPDGSLGIRQYVESQERPGELVSQDEYWRWIFDNSLPGLPEKAALEGLSPLQYMRKYGAYEIKAENYMPFMQKVELPEGFRKTADGRAINSNGDRLATIVDGIPYVGFHTPSGRLEFFTTTMQKWGWPELEYVVPWTLKSHVHPSEIKSEAGEMVLLPNFRLPTLIHTRSANCKWLYEISHNNPVWIHPKDAARLGVKDGDLIRIETEIGWFVDKVWLTQGIKPGILAMSHHLGRWRLETSLGGSPGMSALASLETNEHQHALNILEEGKAWASNDPDTSRIWWKDIGVHQNLTHAVQPDPISGAHCWLQKILSVRKAKANEKHGSVHVDTTKSFAVYKRWHALTRSAVEHSPDGTRRPYWLKRPLKPVRDAYNLPEKPFGR
jgi:anaerobic selenocysteine-containing dehydrogenase